jgi:transcriptional regulator with XRE-family HTH domain
VVSSRTVTDQVPQTLWASMGRNIARLRSAQGLAQVDLSDLMIKCGVPWTSITVAKVETGRRDVTVGEMVALGYCLRVGPAKLLETSGPVFLAKGSDAWVPGEAVGLWADGGPLLIDTVIRWQEDYPEAAPIWQTIPGSRDVATAMRRMGWPKAFATALDELMPRVSQRLAEWIEKEEAAGRPVTEKRRLAKESYLWRQEAKP